MINCKPKKQEEIQYLFNNDSLKITKSLLVGVNGEITSINDSLLMFRDSIFIKTGTIQNAPMFQCESPLINAIYRMSIRDMQMRYLPDSGYFVPSTDTIFNQKNISTREVAIASDLSLAYFMPNEVISHLRAGRDLRLKLRFQHPVDAYLDNSNVANKAEKVDQAEFVTKYGTLPILKQTDDIVWVIGWSKAARIKNDKFLLREMVELFDSCNSVFYQKFYDDSVGLYRGQPLFVDVDKSGGLPYNLSVQQCANLYALSTNCLYVSAFDNLAYACQIIGDKNRSVEFQTKATALRDTIQSRFLLDNKSYAYFLHSSYFPENRNEVLGSSLVELTDIDMNNQSPTLNSLRRALYGVAQLDIPYSVAKNHGNAVQPFTNAYFNRARYKTSDKLTVLSEAIAEMGYLTLNKNFCQSLNFSDGEYQGYPHYLCSSAANLSVIFDLLLGIKLTDQNSLTIEPCIPKALRAGVTLKELTIGSSIIDISIIGYGTKVKQITLNEKRIGNLFIVLAQGRNKIDITMIE